jgi:hypothetical protein
MMIETEIGYVLSRFVADVRANRETGKTQLFSSSGETLGTINYEPEKLAEKLNVQIIPAFPGFFIVLADVDVDAAVEIARTPVIAWRVDDTGDDSALTLIVRCLTSSSRVLCSISVACCSALLIGTKRIPGRDTASQQASASTASFLPRLT